MGKNKSNLRVVIFAGGIGTRMWPLSRKATPKQFEKIINNKSTLQLTVDRVTPQVLLQNIYISTANKYIDIIKDQLPQIKKENIIGEPEIRDLAPAVGYLMSILAKQDPWGPVAILWSDHLVKNLDTFRNAIQAGADYIRKNPNVFVFLGQKARFPNQNLGWIEHGNKIDQKNGFNLYEFVSWHYRPSLEKAKEYFANDNYSWNPGYFIVAPQFVLNQYKLHAPKIYEGLMKLQASYGTPNHDTVLNDIYPKFEKISFDDAIVTKTEKEKAVVFSVELGWSDIGTWEALKEAIQETPSSNITKGNVELHQTTDSLVYNYTDQLVASIGLKGMIVVVTPDVVMVTPQSKTPEIKKLLKKLEGTDKEKYT